MDKKINFQAFSYLPYLALFLGIWIYYGFFSDYLLFFQEKSYLFVLSSDFLYEHLKKPGGLLVYAGKFFTAFYYIPLAGSFFISATIVLIALVLSKIIFILSGKRGIVIAAFAGIGFFYLQTDYHFLLHNHIGILIQLLAFLLVIRSENFTKVWIALAMLPLVYFISGGFAWIFLIMTTLNFLSGPGKLKIAWTLGMWCIFLVIIYLLKEYILFQPLRELVSYPFYALFTGTMFIPLLIISVLIVLLPVLLKIKLPVPVMLNGIKYSQTMWTTGVTIVMLIFTGINGYSSKNRQYFYIEKLFYQEKYDEIISFNRSHPQTNTLSLFLNNIALSETNQLNDLLFQFPQSKDGNTLFLKWQLSEELLKRGGYFYYSTGMINEANRWAYENMVMKGFTPEGLKMLIRTELINGNYKIASRYIGILKRSFFYRKDASKFGELLSDDAIANHKDLGEKRTIRPSIDFFTMTDFPLINLEHILKGNSHNSKALNYKLAFMLLQKDTKGIADMLPELESYGITHLPLNVEEAVVAYNSLKTDSQVVSSGIRIGRSTEERWLNFKGIIRSNGSDLKRAEPQLKQKYGNTFWYYAFYR